MLMAFYGMTFVDAKTLSVEEQDGLLANLPLIEAYRSWYRMNEKRCSTDYVKMLVERVMKDRPMEAIDYLQQVMLKKE